MSEKKLGISFGYFVKNSVSHFGILGISFGNFGKISVSHLVLDTLTL